MSVGALVKRALGRAFPAAVLVKGARAQTPRVALTFDDGPHPGHTPAILDILDAHDARATFFLQGAEAEKHPGLAREIAARGHQVGNHGYSHYDARKVPLGIYLADVDRARDTLQNVLGTKLEPIFRPPHGSVTGPSFVALARHGYRFVFWSADSRDSFIRSRPELVEHVASLGVSDGDILLLHEDYPHTVEALADIVGLIRGRSLGFVAIRDL